MHPLVVAHFQAVHDVTPTGIHCYHFKHGAYINRIALQQQPENPSETIDTLQLPIASPLTLPCGKVKFRKILDYLVILKETYGLALRQSEGAIAAFDLAPDALRAPFVQDLRKGSSYSLLRNHICRLLRRVF
jgi:hypothetical protein